MAAPDQVGEAEDRTGGRSPSTMIDGAVVTSRFLSQGSGARPYRSSCQANGLLLDY